MAEVSSLQVERFMRLPRVAGERWQGGLVRLPTWVGGPASDPVARGRAFGSAVGAGWST